MAPIALVVMLSASCGSGASGSKVAATGSLTTAATTPATTVGTPAASAPERANPPTTSTVSNFNGPAPTIAADDTSLGKILVDGRGMTLYLFTKDADGKSACQAGCSATWPPLTATGPLTAGPGVDATKLATTPRGDGALQVTYAGHPLYRHDADRAPGDVTGQGVAKVWFAVLGSGEAVLGAPQPISAPSY